MGIIPPTVSIRPNYKTSIPSSGDPTRKIKVHIYEPPNKSGRPLPVHVTFHGSGFVLPCHGMDAEMCVWMASTLGCVVVDADYRKAPEHPFPAGPNDAKDVVTWVLAMAREKGEWDADKITVGGFSAGANLCLGVAVTLPKNTIKAVVAWYPPTDWSLRYTAVRQVEPLQKGQPGVALGPKMRRFFDQSYVLPGTDYSDVQLSPAKAEIEAFPPTLIIVGNRDPLCKESEILVDRLKAGGGIAEIMVVPNAGHGWERMVEKGSEFEEPKQRALELVKQWLSKVYA